jgi:hypothetical protein
VYPHHRLEALHSERHKNHKVQAAYLLSLLDQISFGYSYPENPTAESEMLNEIQMSSGWISDNYFCNILVRGQTFGQCSDGFNFVVLDQNFYPLSFINFESIDGDDDSTSKAIIAYISQIPSGVIVLLAVHNNSTQSLNLNIKAALHSIGAKNVDSLVRYISFSLIGIKSVPPTAHNAMQKIAESPKINVTVIQRIPPIFTPLCFECQQPTFSILVTTIDKQWCAVRNEIGIEGGGEGDSDSVSVSMLISSLNLLTTNAIQLIASVPIQEAQVIFCMVDRNTVQGIVDKALKYVEDGGAGSNCYSVVLSMLLRLSVIIVDLYIDTPKTKFLRLFEYFEKLLLGRLGVGIESFVLESLLKKFSPSFISTCLLPHGVLNDNDNGRPIDSVSFISSLLDIGENDIKQKCRDLSTVNTDDSDGAALGNNFGKHHDTPAQVMLATMCLGFLSAASQSIVATKNTTVAAAIEIIFAIFSAVLNSSCIILERGNDVLTACKDTDTATILGREILKMYESSCLKSLLPAILSCLSLVLKYDDSGELCLPGVTSAMIHAMSRFCCLFNQMKSKLGPVFTSPSTPAATAAYCMKHRSTVETFESAHPYCSNERTFLHVNYPGAYKMTFTFDKQSRTNKNRDYIKIWKDAR